ncbi:MAG: DUF2169 domain-containing protein [Myxococcota bacterium]
MALPVVDNRTEFTAVPRLLLDRSGEALVVIVKASFEWADGALSLAPPERMRPVRDADIPWGEPEVSSIAYPADSCVRKPGTDVVVVAEAHAPGGPQRSFDARVVAGPVDKTVRLFGPRLWYADGEKMTDPEPVASVALRYELAFGGFDDSDPERVVEEPRNPIGRGRVRDRAQLTHAPAPQIEDPGALLGDLGVAPAPAGVGAVGRHWAPRRDFAGTYDQTWQETRAPLPPVDFDDRFHVCSAAGLWSQQPLRGGENVRLFSLLPGGLGLETVLPVIELKIGIEAEGEVTVATPHLDTVLIDLLATDTDKPPAIEMVWRTSVPAPRRLARARVVVQEEGGP